MNEELTAEEFGEFLRYMRTSINMNQGRFADELGVRRSNYNKLENGKHMPKKCDRLINSVRVLVKQKIREGA
ncbi:helix-turn-helix transcriptional regulator [Metabacillus dongyingensis]|uniref:helix-turn-helix transcriptional regulator n=1 Tax=Metabacillus dongyingensis TaxID=2874282 RepID=UPI003B8DB7BA